MKLYKGIICSLTAAAILGGCAKEDPFIREYEGPTGSLLTKCLAPSINNPDGLEVMTRAVVPVADDFNVTITRQGGAKSDSQPGTVQYKYSEMPEVLTLPTGDYKVSADYGDNAPAAWDAPYYYGESDFGIEANKITDDVDPIVAKLSNIRVTIVFHPSLLSAMSDDSMVEVKAGNQGVLTFVPSESRSAYFKYVSKSQTLAATFTGIVDGSEVIVTKSYDNVAPGNHYRITFRMHGIEDDAPGTIVSGLAVDASIEKIDMNHTVSGEGEEYLTDDWRPNQGGGTQDPDPGPVTPPVVEKAAPSITAATPTEAGKTGIDLDKVNEVTDNIYCVLDVKSQAEGGIRDFKVEIISDKLTPDELESVGLSDKMDLVNPGALESPLTGLGLPVNVGGKQSVSFDITGFMPMLGILGEGNHEFKLTVTDANGTTVKTLKLHTN